MILPDTTQKVENISHFMEQDMMQEEESLHNLLSESINKQMDHPTGVVSNHNGLMDGPGEAVENETQILLNQSNNPNVRSGRYLKWVHLVFLMILIIIIIIIYFVLISK